MKHRRFPFKSLETLMSRQSITPFRLLAVEMSFEKNVLIYPLVTSLLGKQQLSSKPFSSVDVTSIHNSSLDKLWMLHMTYLLNHSYVTAPVTSWKIIANWLQISQSTAITLRTHQQTGNWNWTRCTVEKPWCHTVVSVSEKALSPKADVTWCKQQFCLKWDEITDRRWEKSCLESFIHRDSLDKQLHCLIFQYFPQDCDTNRRSLKIITVWNWEKWFQATIVAILGLKKIYLEKLQFFHSVQSEIGLDVTYWTALQNRKPQMHSSVLSCLVKSANHIWCRINISEVNKLKGKATYGEFTASPLQLNFFSVYQ